tara:strand:+ start:247 stop:408 length:162 start_codon:yes stop_codon:yes gene_type:complete
MSKMKLSNKDGKIIERNKDDYENNKTSWTLRGWKPYEEEPKEEKKPKKKKAKK